MAMLEGTANFSQEPMLETYCCPSGAYQSSIIQNEKFQLSLTGMLVLTITSTGYET